MSKRSKISSCGRLDFDIGSHIWIIHNVQLFILYTLSNSWLYFRRASLALSGFDLFAATSWGTFSATPRVGTVDKKSLILCAPSTRPPSCSLAWSSNRACCFAFSSCSWRSFVIRHSIGNFGFSLMWWCLVSKGTSSKVSVLSCVKSQKTSAAQSIVFPTFASATSLSTKSPR